MADLIGIDLYPTPDNLARELLAPLYTIFSYGKRRVVDPQAGRGDLLKYIHDKYNVDKDRLYAIEIDPILNAGLTEAGYKTIGYDFLEWAGDEVLDVYVMNPPFSSGAKHLLHACNFAKIVGGHIACILNAETVRNPKDRFDRAVVDIIEKHSFRKHAFVKDAFRYAVRTTTVEVVLIWLRFDEDNVSFDFDVETDHFAADIESLDEEFSPLARPDIVESMVHQYELAVRLAMDEYRIRNQRIKLNGSVTHTSGIPESRDVLFQTLQKMKRDYWRYLFERTNLGRKTTSQFRTRFYKYTADRSNMAFSYNNVMDTLDLFRQATGNLLEQCIVDLFDLVTSYAEENCISYLYDGWKTNKTWKISRKMIVPEALEYNGRYDSFSFATKRRDLLEDLDVVCCWLAGKQKGEIVGAYDTTEKHFIRLRDAYGARTFYGDLLETEFFTLKFFKKGTLHITWKDAELLDKFNLTAARGKKWLGSGVNS